MPQLFVSPSSGSTSPPAPGFAVVVVMIEPMATGTLPVCVTVTACAPTPLKVSEEDESVIGPPAKATPVPVKETVN